MQTLELTQIQTPSKSTEVKSEMRLSEKINRWSLFIVFFWFGFLKVLSISPAEKLVSLLYDKTISGLVSDHNFVISLGILECLIGILFLFPKFTKMALVLFSIQMFTTFLPLFYLPEETWTGAGVLTLTGQYIIKNVVLVACAFNIYCCSSKTQN